MAAISPLDSALSEMPILHLTAEEARRVRFGAAVLVRTPNPEWEKVQQVRLRDDASNLIAIGSFHEAEGTVKPRVLLVDEGK